MMKKWIPWLTGLLVIAICLFSFVYFFAIPKTAEGLVPYKWKTKLLEKKRVEVIAYLGKPIDTIMNGNKDTWIIRNGRFTYTLHLIYDLSDSSIKKYFIEYDFKHPLFNRSDLIAADSL